VNKGVVAFLMAGIGIGMALSKWLAPTTPNHPPQTPRQPDRATPLCGHRFADRLRGYLEVERN